MTSGNNLPAFELYVEKHVVSRWYTSICTFSRRTVQAITQSHEQQNGEVSCRIRFTSTVPIFFLQNFCSPRASYCDPNDSFSSDPRLTYELCDAMSFVSKSGSSSQRP